MARPKSYDWTLIEADYKAGLNKPEIRRKYNVPRTTLDNKIRDEGWTVSVHANEAIKGLEQVSVHLGALEAQNPEILDAVYDRVRTESDFDIRAGRLVIKTMAKLESVVDKGTKLEKINVGDGMQSFEVVDMMGGDYKDVMDAAYRGKELLKGKDQVGPQVAIQNNTNTQNNTITMTKEEVEAEMKRRGLPIDIIGH